MFKNIGKRAVSSMGAKAIMGLATGILIFLATQIRNCNHGQSVNMAEMVRISLTELIDKGIPKEPEEMNSYFLLSDTLLIDSVITNLPTFANSGFRVYRYEGTEDKQKFIIKHGNEYFYAENGKNERIYITCNINGDIIEIN